MKKKIMALCLVVALAVTAITGATLAYFTDTDEATNEFTMGKIDITLNEDFKPDVDTDNDGEEDAALMKPGMDINKDVTITLEKGSEDAYVWYTYAIPAVLDNDNAGLNIVHVNHAGQNWEDYFNKGDYEGTATTIEETWKVDYAVKKGVEIDGILYNVYTTLYNGKLTAEKDTTTLGMTKVYLDSNVDTAKDEKGEVIDGKYTYNGTVIDYDFSKGVKIIVNAYGIQAQGFNNVVEAYNAYMAANN